MEDACHEVGSLMAPNLGPLKGISGLEFGAAKRVLWYTVWMVSTARFSVHILLLHQYKSDLAHISDRYSSVIEMCISEMRENNNNKNE